MPTQPTPPPAASLSIGDIYYTLFRHKWKIAICTGIGLVAGAVYYFLNPPFYQSEAKLVVLYVESQGSGLGTANDISSTKSPDMRGETIMGTEREIIASVDLAKQVAETVGVEKILRPIGGGKDLPKAATYISKNLTVDSGYGATVIRVNFKHPDKDIVQPVLRELIEVYLKKHVEIHSGGGFLSNFLAQQRDDWKNRLADTEKRIQDETLKVGVTTDLDEAKRYINVQLSTLQADILNERAEYIQREAVLESLAKNSPAGAAAALPASPSEPSISVATMTEYGNVASKLESLKKLEQQYLGTFTPESTFVVETRKRIADAEADRDRLEAEHPGLARSVPLPIQTGSVPGPQPSTQASLVVESINLNALDTKIKWQQENFEKLKETAVNIEKAGPTIAALRRQRGIEELSFTDFSKKYDQARTDDAKDAGTVKNINEIQQPSPPFTEPSKTYKTAGGLFAGGLAAGIVWAFVIEMFLDRSVRRPIDVERLLHLPLFLSIPDLSSGKKPKSKGKNAAGTELAIAERDAALHPFHETLRDRLLGYFESRNLTHKPKLVAVTGLGTNAGVTTTAAGLASCLSETGDGNVLLVDMTAGQGSAQQFFKGKEVVGMDDMLSTRDSAQVQDKLFVVTEGPGADKLSRILPQRFSKLIPKLKASDFDYIIFDMPPVSQISITPRLAGFMDMVLLVIESEKTDRDLIQRATALLAQSKAHVGAVLNKTHTYVPARLHQENLGNA